MKRHHLILFSLVLSSCASYQAEQKVDENLKREHGIFEQADIAQRSHDIILNHPSLSDEQRQEMRALFSDVYRQSIILRSETGRLKGVFFKTFLSHHDKSDEVKIIKKRLINANQKKMDLMLDALEKAKKILGKDTQPEKYHELLRDLDKYYR